MDKLAESVLAYVRRQGFLKAGDRAGVAVSGGADSVALLRLLLELRHEIGVVLAVVHFNHNLRGMESEADERYVAQLAEHHQLQWYGDRADVAKHATLHHLSTEAAARGLRYQYFRRLLGERRLNCIATGHTLDDQAETVLLRLVRGAGTRGLAGIYPRLTYRQSASPELRLLDPGSEVSVIRPLLSTRRAQLEAYLGEIGQDWREDSSNRDLRYGRNRVRHGIMPSLEQTLNPKVREALAETAEIARSEEEYWQAQVERLLPEVWEGDGRILTGLAGLPLAVRRRLVRAAAESLGLRLEFRHGEEILGLPASASAMLPQGWVASKTSRDRWQFQPGSPAAAISDYQYLLAVPGMVQVPEAGSWFEVALVTGDAGPSYNPDHMFDPALLQKELTVRNWRAGDRFWPAHTKSRKKVKELLQERRLAGRERKLWPVVASGQEIVWVRGFPAPARLRPQEGANKALVIQEHPQA